MSPHRFRPRTVATVLISGCIAVLLGARPPGVRAQEGVDRVVASVDGDPITVRDLKAFAAVNKVALSDPDDLNSPETRAVLKGVISERLLESEIKKYKNQVEDRQIDDYIANFEQSNGLTDAQLRAQLQAQGHTYEEFRKHARLEMQKMLMIQKEVRARVSISSDEIKAYYDSHPDEFRVGKERFKLAQILIAVPPNATPAQIDAARAKAESIRSQLLKGADFNAMARQYSDDDSRSQGGELGEFSRGEMLDQIQAAIDKLKPGEISPPIQSEHGFHLVKLEAHDEVGVKPFSQVSAQIREKLVGLKAERQFAAWVNNDLVKQHYVETFN